MKNKVFLTGILLCATLIAQTFQSSIGDQLASTNGDQLASTNGEEQA